MEKLIAVIPKKTGRGGPRRAGGIREGPYDRRHGQRSGSLRRWRARDKSRPEQFQHSGAVVARARPAGARLAHQNTMKLKRVKKRRSPKRKARR